MIRADQIPDEVVKEAMLSWAGSEETVSAAMREAITAALSAWPGQCFTEHLSVRDDGEGYCLKRTGIHLPFSQETNNE